MTDEIIFSRKFSMPNPYTFEMKPIAELIKKYIKQNDIIVDPFAGKSNIANYSNDLAESGEHSIQWLEKLVDKNIQADVVLLDPPYSPRQISEVYKSVGLKASATDTQNARLYAECRRLLDKLLKPHGLALSFGWSSNGFGKKYNYDLLEIMLVHHGGAHNDTICIVERKKDDSTRNDRTFKEI